ncbi:DUF2785 domain-containing protein [Mycoplasmatota bacterium WC30]
MDKKLIDIMKYEQKNKYMFEGVDKLELVYKLIEYIGDMNSEIRDSLLYPNIAHLLHDKHLTKEELIQITELLIGDEYLTYDMENKEKYSVLKRSFTTLQLVILVFVHNRDDLYTSEMLNRILNTFINYYKNEAILIGYKEEVGWLHSIAHGADFFAQIVKWKEISETSLRTIFEVIRDKFLIDSYNFVSDEDERTVTAIVNAMNREILKEEFWTDWVKGFDNYKKPETYPEIYIYKNNKKNLLRSLYFRILNEEKNQDLVKLLEEKIKEMEKR